MSTPAQSPLDALREGSTETWTGPVTGIEWTYRRLGKPDLVACPEALPIFGISAAMALTEQVKHEEDPLAKALAERRLARQEEAAESLVEHEAKIEAHLITTAMLSPRVLPDPDDMSETPPVGCVFLFQVPQLERAGLVMRITKLMAGLDALERRLAAIRAANFRAEHDGNADGEAMRETATG